MFNMANIWTGYTWSWSVEPIHSQKTQNVPLTFPNGCGFFFCNQKLTFHEGLRKVLFCYNNLKRTYTECPYMFVTKFVYNGRRQDFKL